MEHLNTHLSFLQTSKHFSNKVEVLKEDWKKKMQKSMKTSPKAEPRQASRAPNKALIVKIGNRSIHEKSGALTFAEVIRVLDVDRVAAQGLTYSGVPLISHSKHPVYTQERVSSKDDRWIMTHISTEQKKDILEKLAQKFRQSIEISFVVKGS